MFSVVPSPQLGEASAAAARSIKMLHVTTRTTASQKPRRRVLISPVLVNQSVPCVPYSPPPCVKPAYGPFSGYAWFLAIAHSSRLRENQSAGGETPSTLGGSASRSATRAGVIGRVTTRGVRSERSALRVPIAERVQQR